MGLGECYEDFDHAYIFLDWNMLVNAYIGVS